jgi:hypothetical protein
VRNSASVHSASTRQTKIVRSKERLKRTRAILGSDDSKLNECSTY